jgi:agmatinase
MSEKDYNRFGGDEVEKIPREAARIVVLPLCYEHAVSYGTGTGQGPLHILTASAQLERLDEQTLVDWGAFAIHTAAPLNPPDDPLQAIGQMHDAAAPILAAGQFLLSLGGDHAISIGPMQAAAERFPGLSVLQIDAHLDLRESWNGSRFNHACVMRRAHQEMGLSIVQVGMRAIAPEEANYLQQHHLHPFFAHDIDPMDDSWIDQVIEALSATVYLTIDLDGLDPSCLPGTGTPEPGGLSYRQLVRLIAAVGKHRHVVAADINELSKIPDSQVSEFTAAKLATKVMVHCSGAVIDWPKKTRRESPPGFLLADGSGR